MIRNNLILDLNPELLIDNFAGGGGYSTGLEMALGRHADHAINHDATALGMHRINHPQTVHHCEDVFHINPKDLSEDRPVGLGHFSPDCTHHSKAKGGKPLSKKIRGLAVVMFRWAAIRTRVMTMENVEEITGWGPLLQHCRHLKGCACGKPCGRPDPKHKGRTWQAFVNALGTGVRDDHPDLPEMVEMLKDPETGKETISREQLVRGFGYKVEWRELRACDFGAPTIRKRLFLVARCDGRPIVWPTPTHSNPEKPVKGTKPWRTIAECIDWSISCPSIFLTKKQAKQIGCKRPLAESTLRRIAVGMGRYVINSKKPFIVTLTHHGADSSRVQPTDEPMQTVTGAHRGEKAVIATELIRYHNSHDGRTDGDHRNYSPNDPLPTQDTSNRFGVVECKMSAPFVTEHANSSTQRNLPADEPLRTQCAEVKGGHFATVAAHLAHVAHGEYTKKGKKRGRGDKALTEPMPTITTNKDGALVTAHLMVNTTGHQGAAMTQPDPTITTGGHQEVVASSLIKLRGNVETHEKPQSAEEPLGVISAGGNHHGLAAAYMAQHNSGGNTNPGHPVDYPISTVTNKGSQQQLVTGLLSLYYGSEVDGQSLDEPMRTVTTTDRFCLAQGQVVPPTMTREMIKSAHRVARFLRKYGVEVPGEFAMVGEFVIYDIGMRMLTPRELFRAQGFPESYVIDRAWLIDPRTGDIKEQKLTKEAQIRMCGNSVCPPVAEALVRANVPEMSIWEKREQQQFKQRNKSACPIAS